MELNYLSIGQRIKAIRKKRGLTQQKLAELIGRSPTFISYIEGGSKPMSLKTFVLLVNALNITSDEVLIDILANTILVIHHEFSSLLTDCDDVEKRFLLEMLTATKIIIRNHKQITYTR